MQMVYLKSKHLLFQLPNGRWNTVQKEGGEADETQMGKETERKEDRNRGEQIKRGEDVVRKQSVVEPAAGTVRNELAVL